MYFVVDKKGHQRLTGRSRAVVIDNRDPEQRGRVQINHPLLGETVWIAYLRTPGMFDAPNIGDIVYIECDSGHYEYPVAWGNLTRGAANAPEIPEEFRRDVPTNRGMFTPFGHLIELDDGVAVPGEDPNNSEKTSKNRGIRITTFAGSKVHLLDDDENGTRKIVIEDPDGNGIIIDRENGSMDQFIDGNWNAVSTDTAKLVASTKVFIDTPDTEVTGTTKHVGDVTNEANMSTAGNVETTGNNDITGNLGVVGNSMLGGGTPLLLATAQFIGTGNLGAPVISSIMTGLASKVTGS